jgi:hypothetical protein
MKRFFVFFYLSAVFSLAAVAPVFAQTSPVEGSWQTTNEYGESYDFIFTGNIVLTSGDGDFWAASVFTYTGNMLIIDGEYHYFSLSGNTLTLTADSENLVLKKTAGKLGKKSPLEGTWQVKDQEGTFIFRGVFFIFLEGGEAVRFTHTAGQITIEDEKIGYTLRGDTLTINNFGEQITLTRID